MDVSTIRGAVKAPLVNQPVALAPPPAGPGKSGMAVGQIAKQAVAEARASGIDLPSNAQGMAASQIAKGADPASIFAALIAPEGEGGDGLDVGDAVEVPVTPEDSDTGPLPDDGVVVDVSEGPTLTDDTGTGDAAALALITQAAQQYAETTGALAAGDSSAQVALDLLS